jgi:hypothetical protein
VVPISLEPLLVAWAYFLAGVCGLRDRGRLFPFMLNNKRQPADTDEAWGGQFQGPGTS